MADHLVRVEAERDQWKRAAEGDRDGLVASAQHVHVVECLVAERKAVEAQHDALRLAVEEEVNRLKYEAVRATKGHMATPSRSYDHGRFFGEKEAARKAAGRLTAILESEGSGE